MPGCLKLKVSTITEYMNLSPQLDYMDKTTYLLLTLCSDLVSAYLVSSTKAVPYSCEKYFHLDHNVKTIRNKSPQNTALKFYPNKQKHT